MIRGQLDLGSRKAMNELCMDKMLKRVVALAGGNTNARAGGLVTHIMKRAETLREIDILCQYMIVKELQS